MDQSASFSMFFNIMVIISSYCKTAQWWCSLSILPNPLFTWEQQIGPRKTQHYKAQRLYIRLSIDELLLHGVNIKSILVHLGSYKSPSYLQLPVFVVFLVSELNLTQGEFIISSWMFCSLWKAVNICDPKCCFSNHL